MQYRTCVKKVITVKLPQGRLIMSWHKVAQEQIYGILLLSISVCVTVEPAYGGYEITRLGCSLPITPLPLEECGVSFRPAILHATRSALACTVRLEQFQGLGNSEAIAPMLHEQ